jgi:NADH-quinone oxidoreductase subunit M
MFPFHTWLPAAHVQAPAAGSVILAAVLLKMGTYGFLRFCLPLTPAASEYFAPLMIGISIASILYGGAVALGQSDIKKLVAYSSVGHMGFVTLGIFLFNVRGVEGALFQMLNHGIVTGGLFMMIGAVYERSHSREITDNMGMGKYLPAFMFFWGLFALASFGFVGVFSENVWLGALVVPGALLAAAYMFRVSLKMAWGRPSSATHWKDLNSREWVYLTIPAVFVLYIGLQPGIFFKLIDPSIEKLLDDFDRRSQVVEVQEEQPLQLAARDLFQNANAVKN